MVESSVHAHRTPELGYEAADTVNVTGTRNAHTSLGLKQEVLSSWKKAPDWPANVAWLCAHGAGGGGEGDGGEGEG
eukprot:353774-Chlamydomonas_euryale.AAC.1